MPVNLTPTTPDLYCELSDIEEEYGVENVRLWSNKGDASSPVDTDRVDLKRRFAYDLINQKLATSLYVTPLVATTDIGLPMITDAAAVIAGYKLCDVADGSEKGKQYQARFNEVMAWLTEIGNRNPQYPLPAVLRDPLDPLVLPGGFESVPIRRAGACCGDEFSNCLL